MRKVFRRPRVWVLAPLFILFCQGAGPAYANGVSGSIANGGTKTGTIATTGHDDYTFSVTQGANFVISVGESGTHDTGFVPQVELIPPGATLGLSQAQSLYTRMEQTNAAAGKWTARVTRMDKESSSGGSYSLKLVQAPGSGTAMTAGQDYSGSNNRGDVGVYTFTGTAGKTSTLTLTPTGGEGFEPEIEVFAPGGSLISGIWCTKSCTHDVRTAEKGAYTILVWKHDGNDVTGNYTLSVNSAN